MVNFRSKVSEVIRLAMAKDDAEVNAGLCDFSLSIEETFSQRMNALDHRPEEAMQDYLQALSSEEVHLLLYLMHLGRGECYEDGGNHKDENILHLMGKAGLAEDLEQGLDILQDLQMPCANGELHTN